MEKSPVFNSSVPMKQDQSIDFVETTNDENDSFVSNPDASLIPTRKRSHSVLNWMKRSLSHPPTFSRQRSATVVYNPMTQPPAKVPIEKSSSEEKSSRERSSTITSTHSTSKKSAPPKQIIVDTDSVAQQPHGLFQFVFLG